jgi:uncharacterized protein DUF3467
MENTNMDEAPEVYSDGVQIAVSPFTVALMFSVNPPVQPGTQAPRKAATVRMSIEHAKVLAIILKKQIKQYEEQQLGQPIALPLQIYQQLGLSRNEDW